jgi:hypothetical protein
MRVRTALLLATPAVAQQAIWGQCQYLSSIIGTNLANESKVAVKDGQVLKLASRGPPALMQTTGTPNAFQVVTATLALLLQQPLLHLRLLLQ